MNRKELAERLGWQDFKDTLSEISYEDIDADDVELRDVWFAAEMSLRNYNYMCQRVVNALPPIIDENAWLDEQI